MKTAHIWCDGEKVEGHDDLECVAEPCERCGAYDHQVQICTMSTGIKETYPCQSCGSEAHNILKDGTNQWENCPATKDCEDGHHTKAFCPQTRSKLVYCGHCGSIYHLLLLAKGESSCKFFTPEAKQKELERQEQLMEKRRGYYEKRELRKRELLRVTSDEYLPTIQYLKTRQREKVTKRRERRDNRARQCGRCGETNHFTKECTMPLCDTCKRWHEGPCSQKTSKRPRTIQDLQSTTTDTEGVQSEDDGWNSDGAVSKIYNSL